jgi:hypothetical protein
MIEEQSFRWSARNDDRRERTSGFHRKLGDESRREPLLNFGIMTTFIANDEVGELSASRRRASEDNMTHHRFAEAWRRAVEYLRAAVRKTSDQVRSRLTPEPTRHFGYARIPIK